MKAEEQQQRVGDRSGAVVPVLKRLVIEIVPINSIRANDYNPNRQSEHDFELLLKSIEEDGLTQPIIVSRENVIVDGEHRWRAAQTLGLTQVPIVRLDLDEMRARVSTIRHNRARGNHDVELEAEVLHDLAKLGAMDWAGEALMLGTEEMDRMLKDFGEGELVAVDEEDEEWVEDYNEAQREGRLDGTSRMDGEGLERRRSVEGKMRTDLTRESRDMEVRDGEGITMRFVFSAEEAQLVRAFMGKNPAAMIYKLCLEEEQGV